MVDICAGIIKDMRYDELPKSTRQTLAAGNKHAQFLLNDTKKVLEEGSTRSSIAYTVEEVADSMKSLMQTAKGCESILTALKKL